MQGQSAISTAYPLLSGTEEWYKCRWPCHVRGHPKTGIYQLRRAVPEDLRALVGKREEKVSLQTRDPGEAKQRFAKALAELEVRWANLRAGPKPLTEREAHQLAVTEHDRWINDFGDNPSQQTQWDLRLGDWLFGAPPSGPQSVLALSFVRSVAA
ncbi:DUF6538 domain-containing protein [Bradyrhizobium sp. UFLA05-112]